ncbi:class I SAM-dependent DNA methyltransferase [Vreelandella malpeensis]|uniref:Class I SAM-dependent methyltransferase n=1 Tax=Vreelandella malpeensis TaxID=1172368 RepID=A0ABS8DVJ3_9GAMM|nr:class I SAM-dependent methyltransferase [Halomonas malpeensis]MCB8890245.1 class I SAM-dependent methyltransferase [Halomonas malpeensis]
MSANALYTDLSVYYDLMCEEIDYPTQSRGVMRLNQLFGNGGRRHLDLACGTGPHVRHFLDAGFTSGGLDINPPMLERAAKRCPEAHFSVQDMGDFDVAVPQDLITCFLYSIHYSADIERLKACIARAHEALSPGGVFCFNAVDKDKIDNALAVKHRVSRGEETFTFQSGWHYPGQGERQALRLSIEKRRVDDVQRWSDEHAMVALGFEALVKLLEEYFSVHVFAHDYATIAPWDGEAGNALFVCIKA